MTSPSSPEPIIVRLRRSGKRMVGMLMPGFGVTADVVTINTRLVSEHRIPDVVAWAEAQRQSRPDRIAFLMASEFGALSVA